MTTSIVNNKPLLLILLPVFALLSGCEPEVNRSRDVHGNYALHEAVRSEDLAALNLLFEEGANANVTDIEGVAPLHRAARDGKLELAELLLKKGANPNMITKAGWSPLHLALWKGHDQMAELLLRFGALPNVNTPEGFNTVHLATMSGAVHALDLLFRDWKQSAVSGKPDPNALDKKGRTALDWAIDKRDDAAASVLLLRGADPTRRDGTGNTLLHRLAGSGKIALAQSIVGAGVSPDALNNEGKTAYDLAVERGDDVLARWLPTVMQLGY